MIKFLKTVGAKLFGSADEPEAPEKVKEHIAKDNPGVDGLTVKVEGSSIKLAGKATTQAAMEKAALLAGNVEGIEEVDTTDLECAAPEAAKVEFYEIESGDTLSKIAERFLGDPQRYQEIFDANREVIKDADLIYPGQKIRIELD